MKDFLSKKSEYFYTKKKKKSDIGTSVAVHWLRLHVPSAGDTGLIPGWGTKIPHSAWPKDKDKFLKK